ncbi:MAG: hypothetical protein ACI4MV_01110 [Christensenellales bacterium]
MKNKNIWLLAISIIILLFDIAMVFILDAYSLKIASTDSKILYVSIKVLVVVLLIITVALSFLKKDSANYILQYITTLVLQFVPLAIRYLSAVENGFLVSIILTFVFLLIYTGIVLGLSALSKKTIAAAKQLEGNTIPVKEERKDEQNG